MWDKNGSRINYRTDRKFIHHVTKAFEDVEFIKYSINDAKVLLLKKKAYLH